jgi:hypothetical protein
MGMDMKKVEQLTIGQGIMLIIEQNEKIIELNEKILEKLNEPMKLEIKEV